MHRQGFAISDLAKVCALIKKSKSLNFQGLYTHFASAKKPDFHQDTEKQIWEFKKASVLVRALGFKPIVHATATAGTLNYPKSHFDMVRIGIGLYGLWTSEETRKALSKTITLKPALTWKTLVAELKWVEKGEKVGYDFTETLKQKSLLAVLPVGYWHGLWRAFSGKAHMLIKGKRCKIIGRVSMDMVVVDVTKAGNVKVGDEVALLGKQGKEEVTADELAKIAGTTNYEIVTRLNPLIKKIYY